MGLCAKQAWLRHIRKGRIEPVIVMANQPIAIMVNSGSADSRVVTQAIIGKQHLVATVA